MNTPLRPTLSTIATRRIGVSMLSTLFVAGNAIAATGIKAAYVESVLPTKPFSAFLPGGNLGAGPGAGTLGITSLTASNGDNVRASIYVFVTEVVGPTCNSPAIGSASQRLLTFIVVPPQSQVHQTFPSPLVVEPIAGAANGLTCLTRSPFSTLSVLVNGFSN